MRGGLVSAVVLSPHNRGNINIPSREFVQSKPRGQERTREYKYPPLPQRSAVQGVPGEKLGIVRQGNAMMMMLS